MGKWSVELQQFFYYLTGTDKKTGKSLFAGPFNSEEEANERGFRLFDGVFEMYKLRTRDPKRAKSMIRWKDFDESGDSGAVRPLFKVPDGDAQS